MSSISEEQVFERRLELVEQSIDRYGKYLFNYLYQLCGHWQDAEDLLHNLWTLVLHKFPEEHLDQIGILRRKARQLFIDYSRRKSNNPVSSMEELPEKETAATSHEPYSEEDETIFMENFFTEYEIDLSPEKRRAVWLYARYGYTYAAIATELNKSPNTIGDWIREARQQFSKALETS